MYVKSQNRKYLANVTEFSIEGINNDQIWGNDRCLGVYRDEDRTIDVLNMIQDALEDGMTAQEDSEGQIFTRELVFEMPII